MIHKAVEDLQASLKQATLQALAVENALGLITDVARSIEGGGYLKPKLIVADGEVMLCVQLEAPAARPPEAYGEVADLALIDPADAAQALDDVAVPKPKGGGKTGGKPKRPMKRPKGKLKKPIFSQAEIDQMAELWRSGRKAKEIAEITGRDHKSIANFIYRNREIFPKTGVKTKQKPPKKSTLDVIGVPVPGAAPKPKCAAPSSRFTAADDLTLARQMDAGNGIGTAAAILRIPRDICQARWSELLPEKTPEAIKALISRLEKQQTAKTG